MTRRPRLLFLVHEGGLFCTHRLGLARAAHDAGFDVVVACRVGRHRDRIEREGLRTVPIKLRRGGRNPIRELVAIADLIGLYRRERPDLIHQVSIKPVLYGSLAARLAESPAIVNAVPGLGHVFVGSGWKARMVQRMACLAYRTFLPARRSRVIFQNPQDRDFFLSRQLLESPRAVLIRGAGVNVDRFTPVPEPDGVPIVMLAARLIWTKGVGEFVEAMRRLKERGVQVRGVIVGVPDGESAKAVPEHVLRRWHEEGLAEWWGHRDDMSSVVQQSAVAILPTTVAEGVPKALLEAAACGRPIVATDAPGVREIVRHEHNGLLVPPRDPAALAAAIERLVKDRELRARFGQAGRHIAVREFSESLVIDQTLAVYRELLGLRYVATSPVLAAS